MKKIYIVIGTIVLFALGLFFYLKKEDNEVITNIVEEELVAKKDEEVIEESCYVDVKGEVVNPGVYKCVKNDKVIDLINKAGGLTKNANTSLINLSKLVWDQMLVIIYSNNQINDAKARLNEPTIVEVIREIEKECVCIDNVNDACEFNETTETTNIVNEPTESKININTATKEELMNLPKIGEAKATAIIEYRGNTPFNNIEDIKNVSGIGDALFEDIKELIEV